ncbi:MAG: R3H domain-containing nucleic acid-binding protein [Parcubacteria group bacterium]
MSTTLDLTKREVQKLLSFLGTKGEVSCTLETGRRPGIKVQIETQDSRRLIGQHGITLAALQYLTRLLVSGHTGKPCFASLDVNDYKSKREQQVVDLAKQGAEKALRSDSMVVLRPMSSYERRIVHTTLQKIEGVATESLGQEPNRRVVIKALHESRVLKSFAQKGFTLDDIKI